jgi:hypothetical protein
MYNRNIRTKYFVGKRYADPIQTNSSRDANTAVAQAVLHMQVAHYRDDNGNPATSCEVYDNESGMLHAIVTRSAMGQLQIAYKRDPEAYETRLAIGALFGKQKEK